VNKYLSEQPNFDLKRLRILSLDLTRATDTFSQELCARLLRGYLSHPKVLQELLCLEALATCGVKVHYPKSSNLEILGRSERGILIGNPSSWFLLNMFTRFFWELSGFITREFRKTSAEVLCENLARLHLAKFPQGSFADPLTNRCGDDQISLCSPKRAAVFEGLLPLGGGIISPGVHLRSESYGIYTKQLCFLDREQRKASFVDILRARQLSTPDSRIPGKKEVPPSWSRGLVATRETSWWDGPVRKGALTFLHWRYHRFLSYARALGLEPYLPRVFGGMEFPHYQREVRFLSGKTKRMLSILLRNDISLEHLMGYDRLGALWNPVLYGNEVAEKARFFLESLLKEAPTRALSAVLQEAGLETPEYPNIKALRALLRKIPPKDRDWRTFQEFSKELLQGMFTSLSWEYPAASISHVPSLAKVAREFKRVRETILKGDPYEYRPLKVSTFKVLQDRLEFKMNSLVIWGITPEMIGMSF